MKKQLSEMLSSGSRLLVSALFVVAALGGMKESNVHAQAKVVARDTTNPYQQGKFSHVKRVLLYNYTLGGHSKTPLLNSMTRLARKYGFQLDVGGTATYITNATLAMDSTNIVDVAVFSNGDGDVLQNATSLAAMHTFVEVKGKGLLNSHAAAAYVPCPTSGAENLDDANCKWLARVMVRQYLAHDPDPHMARAIVDTTGVGQVPLNANAGTATAAINHGIKNQEIKNIFMNLPDNDGVLAGTTAPFRFVWDSVGDEWYNYRGYVRSQGAQTFNGILFGPIIVLYTLDEKAPYWTTTVARMGDRVEAWARHVGNGLTAYVDHGHSDVYSRVRRNGHVNDSAMEKLNWRVLRYLARDFVGCMDATNSNFNPEASVTSTVAGFDDVTNPCVGGTPIVLNNGSSPYKGISVASRKIHVMTPEKGRYQVLVVDIHGKQYFSRQFNGGDGRALDVPQLNKGVYFVHVTSPKNVNSVAGVSLN